MTPSEHDILDMMERFGGAFVFALARAWRQADEDNKARLRKAFPEYWEKYRDMVIQKWIREAGK